MVTADAGGNMGKKWWHEWQDLDEFGKRFWNSTIQFWSGDYDHEWNIDDYESMKYWASKSGPWQDYANTRVNEMYNDELERYYDDLYKNTGQDHSKTKYPILQDKRHYNDSFTVLQASEAVKDFYAPFSRYKWW